MRTRLLSAACLLALILPGRGNSDPPSPPAKRSMGELVAALGADDPQTRDAAKSEIPSRVWDWTPEDVLKLEEATRSKDAEVAARAVPILQTISRRLALAKAMEPVKDWDKAAVLEGDDLARVKLLDAVVKAWTSGRVPEDAYSAVFDLALQESWFGADTGELLTSTVRENGSLPLCRGQIVRLCDSENVRAASAAAEAASGLDIREAVPAICRAIQRSSSDGIFDKLQCAAAILEVAKDATLMKQLSESGSADARLFCVRVIEREFATERAELLPRLLGDTDPRVKLAAFNAICIMGRPEHLEVLLTFITHEDMSQTTADLSGFRGRFEADVLAKLMQSTNEWTRSAAVSFLRWARAPQGLLERSMHDPSAMVRMEAADVTGWVADPKSAPKLIELLSDGSVGVRNVAAGALGRLKSAEALPALRKLASSRKPKGSFKVLLGIARIGDPSTIPDLLVATTDEQFPGEPLDQLDAGEALGLIDGPEALARLRALKGDEWIERSRRTALAKDGEPRDREILTRDTPLDASANIDWLILRPGLADSLGVMMEDLPAFLRDEKPIKPPGAFAANARHATKEQATDELVTLLQKAAQADDGCSDNALVALIALGKSSVEQQRRILRRVRARGDWKLSLALSEAMARAHEPEAWEAWIRESPVEYEIRTRADAVAFMASRGIELVSPESSRFNGRIAKGHVISLRRICHRLGLERCVVFDGPKVRFLPEAEALRWWSDRLDR